MSARRAVATSPSMRLRSSLVEALALPPAGSSVALHMKTAMPSSASRSSSASTIGMVKRPKLSFEMMPMVWERARRRLWAKSFGR